MWRTKKFRIFVHHILDEVYLLPKLKIAGQIGEVPKEVRESIERVNALRNALAHSFFPRTGANMRGIGK